MTIIMKKTKNDRYYAENPGKRECLIIFKKWSFPPVYMKKISIIAHYLRKCAIINCIVFLHPDVQINTRQREQINVAEL